MMKMLRVKDIREDQIVFYDCETTSVYPSYCRLKMLAYQLGINSEPQLVEPDDEKGKDKFRRLVNDPHIIKVSHNGINFDDIVLWRHGFYVHPIRRHDTYLALKTIHPTFLSYSLKFINWAIKCDQSIGSAVHEPQSKVEDWLLHADEGMDGLYLTPKPLLKNYCLHDVVETVNVFLAVWEQVQKPEHWKAYRKLELAMAQPLHEMMLLGREYLDIRQIVREIGKLEVKKEWIVNEAYRFSHGQIENIASVQQIDKYFRKKGWQPLPRTDKDRPTLTKADKLQNITRYDKEDEKELPRFKYVPRENRNAGYTGEFNSGNLEDLEKNLKINVDNYLLGEEYTFNILSYEINRVNKAIYYLRSYYNAAVAEQRRRDKPNNKRENGEFYPIHFTVSSDEPKHKSGEGTNGNSKVYIPKAYRLSAARTRRFQSSSKYKINWQNQNKESKKVQLVPRGWLGFWLDSTQIENVAHIYYSKDDRRRKAYTDDVDWNEYVWLYNTAYGTNLTKAELDKIDSPLNPQWSVYKQFKTVKLALNFGMGPPKFAKTTGLTKGKAESSFDVVHKACPAIRQLQNWVRSEIKENGYIADPFGHIYSGKLDQAYKIVAYLVQGTGTGSVPKAMTVANYKTLHELDSYEVDYVPWIKHPYTNMYQYGVLTGTTHDECSGRISLGIGTEKIYDMIEELIWNMEEMFSPLFDDIPLRAKLSLSITNAADAEEIDHRKAGFRGKVLEMIKEGKRLNHNVVK